MLRIELSCEFLSQKMGARGVIQILSSELVVETCDPVIVSVHGPYNSRHPYHTQNGEA